MNIGLNAFFSLLNNEDVTHNIEPPIVGELFSNTPVSHSCCFNQQDIEFILGLYASEKIDFSQLPDTAQRLYELSANAFDAIVHVWMSELPFEQEILRFGRKILAAKDRFNADRVACNRSDAETRLILETAYKVWHEIDRLRGLLRFSPVQMGIYIAHCEPDYFVLPALAEHFNLRFGKTPWAIIDDKRNLFLHGSSNGTPEIKDLDFLGKGKNTRTIEFNDAGTRDPWEHLWLDYHNTINNESRKNLDLQCQLMPKRYWKNLPEMKKK